MSYSASDFMDDIQAALNVIDDDAIQIASDDGRNEQETRDYADACLERIRALLDMTETLLPALGLDTSDFNGDARAATAAALARIEALKAEPVTVHVALDGGLIHGVSADRPCDVIVYDYDTEGADDDEVSAVPQDGADDTTAVVGVWPADVAPEWIARVIAATKACAA